MNIIQSKYIYYIMNLLYYFKKKKIKINYFLKLLKNNNFKIIYF